MTLTGNTLFLTNRVNQGMSSAVYRVPNTNHVAKVRDDGDSTALYYELEIARRLHNAGIKVPKPIGLTKVLVLDGGKKVERPAFIQEEIEGTNVDDMHLFDFSLAHHADNLRRREIKKARELGFIPGDAIAIGNAIYNEEENITYLIDFEDWLER